MNNHEKLLSLFNELDELLRKLYRENNRNNSVILRFTHDLNKVGTENSRLWAKKLNGIRVLRNTLIHDLNMNSDHLIEITDETIEFLNEVVDYVRHPKTAIDIATPIDKIYLLNVNNNYSVKEVMTYMRTKGFTQVPVVNEKGVIQGVFSPNALFGYLQTNSSVSVENLSMKDIFPYLGIDNHFSESYFFIKEDLREDDVGQVFVENFQNNKKVSMLFVTKTGSPLEPLKGIIVIKDIINNDI